jgi:hypothetical protein
MTNHLVARPPLPGYLRLRFVTTEHNWLSNLIRWETQGTVSHVESILPGGDIIGAYLDGIKQIPGDSDLGYTSQIFVDVEASQEAIDKWVRYLKSRVGRKYDFLAALGFMLHMNIRTPGAFICSMDATLGLRISGTFPRPLSEPAHRVSPRDLLFALSAHPAATIGQLESLTP